MKKLISLFIVILAGLLLTQAVSAVDSDVVINEFFAAGTSGNDYEDWIELYNGGDTTVDLNGWSLYDSDSRMDDYCGNELDFELNSDEYYVIGVCNRLNTGSDEIKLYNNIDGSGIPIDEVSYGVGEDVDYPELDETAGRFPDYTNDFQILNIKTPDFENYNFEITLPGEAVNVDEISAIVTMEITGVDFEGIEAWVESESGQTVHESDFAYNAGVYSVDFEIRQYSEGGTWDLVGFWLYDDLGDMTWFADEFLGNPTFEVESSTPDIEAPLLTNVEFNVDTAVENDEVLLTIEIVEINGFNLDGSYVEIESENNEYDYEDFKAGADEGTYVAEFNVNSDEVDEEWFLNIVRLEDDLGNTKRYDYKNFGQISFVANPSGVYGLTLTDPADQTVDADANAVYEVTVTNTGDYDDTITLAVEAPTTLETSTLSSTTVELDSGATTKINLTIKDETGGDYTVNVTATSDGDPTKTQTVSIKTTVQEISEELTIDTITQITTEVGEDVTTITRTFTVDSGDSEIEKVYFTLEDLELSWTSHRDGNFDASNIKFYEGTTEITQTNLLHLSEKEVTVEITIPEDNDMEYYGLFTGTINVKDAADDVVKKTTPLQIEINPVDFNEYKNDIKVDWEEFPDDDTYYPMDEVTVTVQIENDYSEDLEDMIVHISNPDLELDVKSSKFNLDKDETKDIDFTFEIPSDVTEKEYKLYIFVEAEDADESSNDLFYYELSDDKIDVDVENHHLRVDIELDQTSYDVGDTITGTVKIYNIGSDKEEDVRLTLSSSDLSYSKTFDQVDSIKSEKTKSFEFEIPTSAISTGSKTLNAEVTYENIERQDDQDLDDHLSDSIFITLGGLGGNSGTNAKAAITGTVIGTANVGDTLKFTLNLENKGTSSTTYTIKAEGYSDWATARVEPAELTIPAGTSVPFYAYVTSKQGENGSQTATIVAYVGTEKVADKTLTVTVNGAGSVDGSGITISDLGNAVTGAAGLNVDMPTAVIVSALIAGMVVLGAIYMFTLGKNPL
jgi:uncharacterized membrane protein